jgi:hypothetical protein
MMRVEQRDVYVADDGKIFQTEAEAVKHDKLMAKRESALSRLKVVRVAHSFDGTEGKGYFGKTIVVTNQGSGVITQYCLDRFGAPLSGWYGDGFYEAWLVSESDSDTVEWAMAHHGFKDRYASKPWDLAVVSPDDFTWAGLPKSTMPWPRTKPDSAKRSVGK